ncbi:small subunit ribosomal protein S24e [Methanofollis sp. W23]|uniref:30S ribosomal protein S24e n=1 Tax=Methanofollis sp. W23 TaxID=2817849 RepID=UPI001AE764CA|nr:30S ribosomal protein S24e [Methanofollis sp. W23]MBP2146868.1 small subunit ribosomal protein S24e [Methanofollis sp. W23]
MEFNITRDYRNELLSRREVSFALTYDGATPSRDEILGKLGAKLDAKRELMVLETTKKPYGVSESSYIARIYDTADELTKTERAYMITRSAEKKAEAEEAE